MSMYALTILFYFYFDHELMFSAQCDFYDTEEYRSDVRTQFNKVNCLDVETGHDKGGIRIDDMFIDFGKIS